jgi:OOP family OmpA-OmpF porin
MVKKALAALVLLGMLSACDSTHSLKQLRSATPQGDAYAQALAASYRDFAEQKVERYDWWTSRYFADKGLMAAYGRDITPEEPSQWDIPATMINEFLDARGKLVTAIAANRSTQPEITAAAVVAYDRWVELEHNRWNRPAIDDARDVFFDLLTKLSEAHTASGDVPTTTIPAESTSAVLYFPLGSDTLGDSALAALAELVRYVQSSGNVTVNINGHADRVGSEDYNMSLSERRARFIKQKLEKTGIAATMMQHFAFGETDPAIPTADGVNEPRNRRVEIYIE